MWKHPHLRALFLVSALVAIALPFHTIRITYPAFFNLLVQQTEEEAQRVAAHLAGSLLDALPPGQEMLVVSPAFMAETEGVLRDFGLMKFRIFSPFGRILASSEPREVGRHNDKPYFHQEVARGRVHTRTVVKNHRTSDGALVTTDVVETYVPLMRNGRFLGAFEIYYDITRRKALFDGLFNRYTDTLLAVTAGLLGLFLLLIHRAARTLERQCRAELATRESEARQRAILAAATDAVLTLDRDGRIEDFNPAAAEIFGYRAEEVRGEPVFETLLPHQLGHNQALGLERYLALAHEERDGDAPPPAQRLEMQGRRADGGLLDLELSVAPVGGREPPLFTVIARDITERKQMLVSLEDALTAAQQASQAKSAFLASTSHEIRTPLNAILGMAQLLEESPLDDQQRQWVQVFRKAGDNLLVLLNDILDLSKIEAGQLALEHIPFSPRALLEETASVFQESAARKEVVLTWEVAPQVPEQVLGDEARVRQVLFNLVGNAVKFTERGGVHLRVKPATRPGERDMLLFSVADTGIGIPREKQGAIFAAFAQVDSSTSRKFGGTGLGLNICTRLVELMAGRIWVQSAPEEGSTFYFTAVLPNASEEGGDAPLPTAEFLPHPGRIVRRERVSVHPMNILLVDDSEDNRLLVQAFLRPESHQVDVAENGQRAVEMFQRGHYDLILMDMQMPVLDGYAATRAIRRLEEGRATAPIPIIALTAFAMKDDTAAILAAGCDMHLTKPIKKTVLMEVIAKLHL